MRSYMLGVLTLTVAMASIGDPAPARAAVDAEPRITLHVENLPLREALARVGKEAGAQFQVAADVPDLPVSLDVQNETLRQVVWMLTTRQTAGRFMGIKSTLQNGVFQVRIDPVEEQEWQRFIPTPPDPRLSRKMVLTLKQTPLREALATLFQNVPRGYVIEEAVPDVPLDLSTGETTTFEALQQVLSTARKQVADLELSRGYGIYRFTVRDRRRRRATDVLFPRKLALHLRSVPVGQVMGALMMGSGLQYSVDPEVDKISISLDVSDATVQEGLQAVARAVHPKLPAVHVVYTRDVYLVTTRAVN